MNLVLAVDEQLAERARVAAQAIGKSLNQAVRDDLEQLAGRAQLEPIWRLSSGPCAAHPADSTAGNSTETK